MSWISSKFGVNMITHLIDYFFQADHNQVCIVNGPERGAGKYSIVICDAWSKYGDFVEGKSFQVQLATVWREPYVYGCVSCTSVVSGVQRVSWLKRPVGYPTRHVRYLTSHPCML